MKRRITVDQLQELTPEQRQKLRGLWQPTRYDIAVSTIDGSFFEANVDWLENFRDSEAKELFLPLLSIGKMIELLQDKAKYFCITNMFARTDGIDTGWGVYKPSHYNYSGFDVHADELCNALWYAVVKEVL